MSALLEAHEASVVYRERGAAVRAVDAVSFRLERGERLGIVGESGCGKSSLLRAALGLEPLAGGRITFDGAPVWDAPKALRRRFQPVFQDASGALDPRLSVAQVLAEPFEVHGRPVARAALEGLLAEVRLAPDVLGRRPAELSAGQRQRVCLARALALEPELLLLDEPVSALDVSVQAQLLAVLEDRAAARGLAFVFVSHDLEVVAHLCPRVLVMDAGRVVEEGAEVLSRPQHPVTKRLVEAARGGR